MLLSLLAKVFSVDTTRILAISSAALLISSTSALASQCPQLDPSLNDSHLSARYAVTSSHGGTGEINLLRNKQQVIYQHSADSFELWNQRGEYVRYFPIERRSVSYRRGDLLSLNMHFDFEQLKHLVAPNTLGTLQQSPSAVAETATCGTQMFTGEHRNHRLTLNWLATAALPQSLTVSNQSGTIQYQLIELKPFSADEFNSLISGYQDIDFADVGDNESDPFIAKMIHQGFIQHGSNGFYDSEGNKLSSTESSHKH